MPRNTGITIRLTSDEAEWLRRKAHWEAVSMSSLVREQIHYMIRDEGYLRPPDDEPQDFGFEKEMMQLVLAVQKNSE